LVGIGEIEMVTRREYTAQEIEQVNVAEQHLRARGLDEGSERVVDVLDGYYQANRAIPVTAEAIVKLLEAQPGLKWLSPAELEYRRIAAENPAAAQQLADWLAKQGKPGTLVNQGDQYFENMSLLLTTLRGYDINSKTILDAQDRIANRPGKKLQYVPQPRRTAPVSPLAKADDGKPFLGETAERLNEPEWVKRSRARSEREAAEAASRTSSASVRLRAAAEAREKAESLQSSTHAETDQLRKIFVTSGTEIDWVQTLAARLQMQQQFNKHRAVARFIR
jgi:hypothetical protein